MLQLVEKVVPTDFIIKAVCWILGEVGSSQEPQKVEELCLSLIKCLEHDYEAESTKVWVIDAIIKLSSTKEFQLHDRVKTILNSYSGNNEIELYQRSLESKKLAKYNAALRFHSKISFDEELSFLEGFINNARKNGAKEYKKVELSQVSDAELRFTPYEPKKIQSSFPFAEEREPRPEHRKVEEPEIKTKIEYEPKVEVVKEKPKKQFITPEEKAKKNLANTLFGGGTKPKPAALKGPAAKQTKNVETTDLL